MKIVALMLFMVAASSFLVVAQDGPKPLYPPMAPALMQAELTDRFGVGFKLENYRGKVVLLNIWGTWCGPCRAETPGLEELHNEYNSAGLEIIGLNVGDGNGEPETKEMIEAYRSRLKIEYQIATAVESIRTVRAFYAITKAEVVPQSILIDREGRMRAVFVGGGPRVEKLRKEAVKMVMADQ